MLFVCTINLLNIYSVYIQVRLAVFFQLYKNLAPTPPIFIQLTRNFYMQFLPQSDNRNATLIDLLNSKCSSEKSLFELKYFVCNTNTRKKIFRVNLGIIRIKCNICNCESKS